jgi:hypothetical protein
MQFISKNFRIWLHGLVAAAVTALSTAATGALALPGDFNFSHDGLIKMAKLVAVPTALSVFAYLKKSPLPSITDNPENGQK